ncbi:polysaccharide pyruvyl transferase family protein [Nesterenkonia sp. LB17]|uniref:polysaccharide pyruvyl transferase family protein n=1 Tax=Nesterenkonia sp. LB17 TaxID=2901230 RepID=UPI001F4CCC37|nr:polysaccharide pyruvyl transferase family protein [Nesterenkonia sp. LB17]
MELRTNEAGGAELIAFGESDSSERFLRNTLLGQALLVAEPREHHVIEHFSETASSRTVLDRVAGWAQFLISESSALELLKAGKAHPTRNPVAGFWWDKRSNFGDSIGPWVISAYSGRPTVNARFMKVPGRTLVSVGSVIQMIKRPNADIWGSGLIREINEKHLHDLTQLKGVRVHAVRGKLTHAQLTSQLDWDVPEVFGDPALLLPRVYTPTVENVGTSGVSFVPHYSHRKWLDSLSTDGVSVVDVRNDLTTVIDQIASSDICVSTSLHGLIIAQAFGVPWVWLNVTDEALAGARFKFDDYFSTLDASVVAEHQMVSTELETLELLKVSKQATLPRLSIDLDALEAALPITGPRSTEPAMPKAKVKFSWSGYPLRTRLSARGNDLGLFGKRVVRSGQRRISKMFSEK